MMSEKGNCIFKRGTSRMRMKTKVFLCWHDESSGRWTILKMVSFGRPYQYMKSFRVYWQDTEVMDDGMVVKGK